jgi:large subunit ribosomal protein L11
MTTPSSNAPKMYKGIAKLIAYAGNAKPNPKMGQALGPLGLNMMQICKEFNERTSHFRTDMPMRIVLKAYTDRSYNFVVKPPPTSWFLKRCAMIPIGSPTAGRRYLTHVGVKYIYEIAKIKKELDPDLKNCNLYGICLMIMAQADNMGLEIEKDQPHPDPTIPKRI